MTAAPIRQHEACPAHDRLEHKIDQVLERLGKGDSTFATVELRLRTLERVVFAAVSVGLLAIAMALLSLIIPPIGTPPLVEFRQPQERPQSR
jgi:hypothetical protein